ncbi:valine--tRNA ligase [Candidatus Saccharibacteria bacterium]|nr:MAG: valine--tRNA ligase [Candidatus Saccharibacteria bacterium]
MKLARTYTPNEYEPIIYAMWEKSGAFAPSGMGEPYSIVMPPPNANGNLHIGHALDMSLKDMLARYYRLRGRDVAYIPGADHAGFETWVVYERHLLKTDKSRFDYSREELYSQVWDFVTERRGDMELQLRALGTSCSWDDLVFTLDSKVISTVYETFQRLWNDGLVYRGERIVNYCTTHQTSFADIEVEHKDEKGKLWHIAYPTLDHIGEIVVATTRPETMLGDTAVAVHPDDERYQHLIGTRVILPIVNRELPIIADPHVDQHFGTGAVKITPAHDPNDFDMAQRHDIESINVIDQTGKMENVPSQFEGMTVEECRERVLANLKLEEYLRGEEEIEHAVGHCYKCGTVIQPLMMDQWFIRLAPLAEKAIAALKKDEITFYPHTKRDEIIAYLSQIRDWNISRQIPWGIPIPAFVNVDDPSDWIFDTRVAEPTITVDGKTYKREEDTFDTWFSSGQWPYAVTDYLDKGELSRFFPTDIMETGSDLLRQWVSRMIMLSLYATQKIPFRTVYFHGMVNDEHNQKMSKSKGNVVNPMELVSEYGSDALRMGIVSGRSPAQAQAFNKGAIIAGRNFCNKLWNIARFVENAVGNHKGTKKPEPKSLADHWVMHRLDTARRQIDEQMAGLRFSEAVDTVYHVVWDDVADWYLEVAKVEQNADMLVWVLDTALILAHPFAPFVTETIWQTLPWHDDLRDNLITAVWPGELDYSDISAGEFARLQQLVSEVRFVAAELPHNRRYRLLYVDDSLVSDNAELIGRLVHQLEAVEPVEQARGLRLAANGRDAWLDIDEATLYEHQSNLETRLGKVRQSIATLEGRLSNERYVSNAPAHLVEETRQQLADERSHEARLANELQALGDK